MKPRPTTLLLALPFLLLACAAEDEPAYETTDTTVETAEPVGVQEAEMTMGANLSPVGDSGISGRASLEQRGEQVLANVELSGSVAGAVHQGHVHQGTCEALGSVVAPLEPVTIDEGGRGTASATVDLDLDELMDGPHVVAYHEAGGSPGRPVACGAVVHE